MAYPYSDCDCVQGIEQFIDPRPYYPQWDSPNLGDIDIPIWEKNMIKAAEKKAAEAAAIADASETEELEPERVLKLVVHKNALVVQDYAQLIAYQVNSFYVRLSSLDASWKSRNVSLVFENAAARRPTPPVPILELGKPVLIPNEVLVPGELKIHAIAACVDTDNKYSVISTEPIIMRVYDSGSTPIEWPRLKDYDIYFQYQTAFKNLMADFEALKNSTPTEYVTSVNANLTCTTGDDADQDVEIPVTINISPTKVVYKDTSVSVTGLNADSAYVLTFSLPLDELNLDNIDMSSLPELETISFCTDEDTGDKLSSSSAANPDAATIVIDFPTFTITIPESLKVTSFDIALPELTLSRTTA